MKFKQSFSFNEWLKKRDPLLHEQVNEGWKANAAAALMGLGSSMGLVNAQSPTPTPNQAKQQEDRSPENIFKGYIVAFKEVSPIKYIRMAQHDKEKFDDDYENLQKPSDDDLGFATLKEKFNKPIRLIVVDDEAYARRKGKYSQAYLGNDHKGPIAVLRRSAFSELPTETSDGKLTPVGISSLSHELRHGLQNQQKTPQERAQKPAPADGGNNIEYYKHYMNDPREMGVRIAALKNLMSMRTILTYLYTDTYNDATSKAIKSSLPQDEKQRLNFILDPDMWKKQIIEQNPKIEKEEIDLRINNLIKLLSNLNQDAKTLMDFSHQISPEERKIYIKEILQHYDKVVHNQTNLSHPQRT